MTVLTPSAPGVAPADRERILAHYRLAAPMIAGLFDGTPLVYATCPRGLDGPLAWHGPLHVEPPSGVATVDVATPHGNHAYLALKAETLAWVFGNAGAVELHGWGCTAADPLRARFARILLELDATHHDALSEAATTLRGLLQRSGLQCIPLLLGTRGIALWIPVAGGPTYPEVRGWLHTFCSLAAARQPALFSTEPNSHVNGRVHLHVKSNAPGLYSALPYSLRHDEALRMCTPLLWEEVGRVRDGDLTAKTFPSRIAALGDVFAAHLGSIGDQALPPTSNVAASDVPAHRKPIEPHGRILHAAQVVLADGQSRDAATILKEALAQHLVAAGTQENYVYTSLVEYIVRTSGHGHEPLIVQLIDRRFRLNVPPDDWPRFEFPPATPPDARAQGILDRLAVTSHGDDPRGFEIAVCDAFAHLGFVATHIGGNQNPDGYADAPLGELGYRTMIECKTARGAVHKPDAVEAVKFKAAYGAQFCAMVGTVFAEDLELGSELQAHGIAAFAVDDLAQLLRVGSNPLEMRPLFAPGFVADRMTGFLWDRLHGDTKRVALICTYIREAGWEAQVAFAKADRDVLASTNGSHVTQAPCLTIDAAMFLVDQRLVDAGSSAVCARPDVEAAFDYLTNPRVRHAAWTDDKREAIVITASP
ncbi:MAG TPA: hypothetical protein VGF86_15945 [Candidatus Tumulicola sp.]|jgi:bifunctional non-homologous end joining protein LigD